MSEREQKALVIAAKSKLTKKGNTWLVPSQSDSDGRYKVNVTDPDWPTCTCPDFELRRARCKHIYAVEIVMERESSTTTTTTKTNDGEVTTTTVTETVKLRYKQVWSAYNTAQVNEKARFLVLLYELCSGIDEPIQMMGRTRIPIRDIAFAAAYKVYSTVSARRFMSDLKDAYLKRYITKLPCYNALISHFDGEELTPYLQWLIVQSSLPLKSVETAFAVDSSGFSSAQYDRWYDEKYGKEESKRDWVKAHIMCGVTTNVVTSAEISGAYAADHNYFAPLVNETAKRFNVREVSADKAYSSYANHRLVDNKNAVAYIDFKKDAVGTSRCEIWNKMYHYYQFKREEFMQHYHKRSNVESTFSMIKAKFGGFVRSKLPVAQTNEVLCKILCHNICCLIQSSYELGTDTTFWGQEPQ
ncbi:MAG TPA: transposase [Blastocatellia bacterium]|nr:transposase [Blastocatellia bacterium]